MKKDYFVGLDMGTDSVGYAVTDREYNLIKYKGEPMWGSHVFEAAEQSSERRYFRTARRRLDRRQERVILTQNIFAKEIAKVDKNFYIRIKESGLYREDTSIDNQYFLFEDQNFTDIDYHKQYPTIHHLIQELMYNKDPKDVRLVYIAVAWFMAHRGHFLSEVDKNNIDEIRNFDIIYQQFMSLFEEPLWTTDINEFKKILLLKKGVTAKEKEFLRLLNNGKKFKKDDNAYIQIGTIVYLLSGGKKKPKEIFLKEEYAELDSISLGMDEEAFAEIVSSLGDDGEILIQLRKIYDWSIIESLIKGGNISDSKVATFERHRKDLSELKDFVKKYLPEDYYAIFREKESDTNYAAYSGHNTQKKKCDIDTFSTFLNKKLKVIKTEDLPTSDLKIYQDIMERIESRTFLEKQVNGDNRVIPYQLYWHELKMILDNAKEYLPFLNERDESGLSASEKLLKIFEFRIPYFVGPLRTDNSTNVIASLRKIKPNNGLVQVLSVTEKQFQKMEFLVGSAKSEVIDSDERVLIL